MDFKQIEAFIWVAKYQNFSKAAKALYLSQPTVSLHISNLEKELETILFDRNSKMVSLTSAGEKFLEYALELENIKTNAIHTISNIDTAIDGTINMASSTTPNIILIPKYLQIFNEKYSNVNFSITELSSDLVIEKILNMSSEIGLIGKPIINDKLNCHKVFDDEIIFIASKNIKIPAVASIDEILLHNFITRSENSATRLAFERTLSDHPQKTNQYKLHNICETDNISTIIQLVKNQVGIAYISKGIYENYIDQKEIQAFNVPDIKIERSLYLITHKNRTLSPASEKFKQFVLNNEL